MTKLNCEKCGQIHPACSPGCCVLVEPLNWIPITGNLPDEGITVLLFAECAGEPVWPGYFDGSTADGHVWRSADGMQIEGVMYWAEMPAGPLLRQGYGFLDEEKPDEEEKL